MVEGIAQGVSDAYEEEGIAYCFGYGAGEVAQFVVGSKLASKLKGGKVKSSAFGYMDADDALRYNQYWDDVAKGLYNNPYGGKLSIADVSKDINNHSSSLFKGTEGVSNPEKQMLNGGEWDNYFKETYGAENVKWETKGNKYDNAIFANDEKLVSHYWKHRKEFGAYSLDDYLSQAREVMNNGYEVNYKYKGEIRTGFIEYYGNSQKKGAKFAFVGTNNDGFITTFHTESGKTFWKMINGENIKVINPK